MLLGLFHLHSRSLHGRDYLLLALFLESLLFVLVDHIGAIFVFVRLVNGIGLLPEKVFVREFHTVNRVAQLDAALQACR